MADSSESAAISTGQPIFDYDILCPHCGYNLRGLTEPRCPECGNPFSPLSVLMIHRDNQPSLPLVRVLVNMYCHPLTFWQLQEVRLSCGPSRPEIFFGLIWQPMLIGMIVASLLHDGLFLFTSLFWSFVLGLAAYILCLIHGMLCRIGLAMSRQREGARAAKEIVGYGLVWFGPLLTALLVPGHALPGLLKPGSSIGTQAAIGLGAAGLTCLLWAVTLFEGGRFASGGSWLVGMWCMITNPAWYILGWVVLAMLYA